MEFSNLMFKDEKDKTVFLEFAQNFLFFDNKTIGEVPAGLSKRLVDDITMNGKYTWKTNELIEQKISILQFCFRVYDSISLVPLLCIASSDLNNRISEIATNFQKRIENDLENEEIVFKLFNIYLVKKKYDLTFSFFIFKHFLFRVQIQV